MTEPAADSATTSSYELLFGSGTVRFGLVPLPRACSEQSPLLMLPTVPGIGGHRTAGVVGDGDQQARDAAGAGAAQCSPVDSRAGRSCRRREPLPIRNRRRIVTE